MAPLTVLQIFTEYVRRKYDELPVASPRIQMLNAIPATLPPEAQLAMDARISLDEPKQAIKRGKKK
jgi:hypothetical protein